MYCNFCGKQLKEDAKFCPACGNAVESSAYLNGEASADTTVLSDGANVYAEPVAQAPVNEAPAYVEPTYVQPVEAPVQQPVYVQQTVEPVYIQPNQSASVNDELSGKQSSVLTFGILSLALAGIVSILSIIFGAMSQKKAKEYTDMTGETPGRVKVGKILGKIGLIIGIAFTAFWTLYISIIVLAAIASGM